MRQRAVLASGSLSFVLAFIALAPSPSAAEPVQLSFDHGRREWSVQGSAELRVESGVPTLYMRRGDDLDVQVTHSNALLYGAAFGELTTEPEDNVAGTVVVDGDAIKTRRDFEEGMYLSFSFAIDSLNLFDLPED